MATVSIVFNSAYTDKEKRSPVVFVIRHKSRHVHIKSGIKIASKYWDPKKMIKKGAPGIADHNRENTMLMKKQAEIQQFLTELTNREIINQFSVLQIKEQFINKQATEKYNFNTYFDYVISIKSESTAKIYQHTLSLINQFHPVPLSFSEVNARFLREFETWNNKSINGMGIHLRNIRHVFNLAIDDEVIEQNLYPFRRVKIKKEETKKRNLNIEDIRLLRDVELSGVPGLARDVFMLQFYLIGINLKDLTYLPRNIIHDEMLDYRRLKTKKNYYIKLGPEASRLIKKLSGNKYLINLAERYQNYDSVKKEINKKLKVAAKAAGIKEIISTYWSRHSWATYAHNLNIPEETISLSLGHSSGNKTTAIYIERNIDKITKANKQVTHLVNMGPHQLKKQYQKV